MHREIGRACAYESKREDDTSILSACGESKHARGLDN
jgi:hypothetical protein